MLFLDAAKTGEDYWIVNTRSVITPVTVRNGVKRALGSLIRSIEAKDKNSLTAQIHSAARLFLLLLGELWCFSNDKAIAFESTNRIQYAKKE